MLSPSREHLARLASLPGVRHIATATDLAITRLGSRPLIAIALSIAFVLCVGFAASLYAAHLSRTTPSWWIDNAPGADRSSLARSTENGVIALMHRPQGEIWSLTLDEPAVNAWIAERLPRWINHGEGEKAWPDDIAELRMVFGQDSFLVAAKLKGPEERIVGATLLPRLTDSGELWLPASWVHLGSLELPGGAVLARAAHSDVLPADLRELPVVVQLLRALAGDRPVLESAEVRLGDGRRVLIRSIRFERGRATLQCETVASAS